MTTSGALVTYVVTWWLFFFMALPFGASTVLIGHRAEVKNFRPFLIPRFSNVYLQK